MILFVVKSGIQFVETDKVGHPSWGELLIRRESDNRESDKRERERERDRETQRVVAKCPPTACVNIITKVRLDRNSINTCTNK